MSTAPHYDRTRPIRTGVDLVNWYLSQHQLGGPRVDFAKVPRDIPDGWGWFRAQSLAEELWPEDADLAVVVCFFPDPLFRRDDLSGRIPHGAVKHWSTRLDACAEALANVGFVVEEWGVPKMPDLHGGADLVVYRLPAGITPAPRTPDALRHARPARPNFTAQDASSRWMAYRALERAHPPLFSYRRREDESPGPGACMVRDVAENLWPPGTTDCVLATWIPDPAFQRPPDMPEAPPGALEHWERGVAHLERILTSAEYEVRRRQRPWHPDTDSGVTLLACRPLLRDAPPATSAHPFRPTTRPRWRTDHLTARQEDRT